MCKQQFCCFWKVDNVTNGTERKRKENYDFIHTNMGNTFSLFQVFLLVFQVLVIAPRRRWMGFFDELLLVVAAPSVGDDDFFLSAAGAELIVDWSAFSLSMLRWLSSQ